MKRLIALLLGFCCIFSLLFSGCEGQEAAGSSSAVPAEVYTKYQAQFFNSFDTIIQIIGYTETEEEFQGYAAMAEEEFLRLNNLFDRFHEYEGINNICTINQNAGVAPVEVPEEILDLVEFSIEWYDQTGGQTNIAMGPVLNIWHSYMEKYAGGSPDAVLPSMEELEAAAEHTDITKVQVDRQAGTVFLEEEGMMLDVGAVAKGYAAQMVADLLYEQGFHSFLISAGGNIVTKDAPLDGIRAKWGVGIQDPQKDSSDPNASSAEVVFAVNEAVVTSGDYQRFYMVGDQRVHHIIDPDTLMPASYYRGLTVVHEDSGLADLFSTALFCMDYDSCRAFAQEHDLKVLWIFADGSVEYTDNLLPQLRDRGGATAAIEQ